MTLEDETGVANAVVWPDVFAANRRVVMSAAFVVVRGRLQRAGDVIHLVAESFVDLTAELARMHGGAPGPSVRPATMARSRDFR